MAAHQPDKKDLGILKEGTPQSVLRAELGQPVWCGEEDGCPVDLFKFRQGYSTRAKVATAAFHGIADVFTLGLWEVVGTPAEAIAHGTDITVKVVYDNDLKILRVETLKGEEAKTPSPEESNREGPPK